MKIFRLFLAVAFFALFSGDFAAAESVSKESVFSKLAENANSTGDFIQTKTISSRNIKLKSSGTYFFSAQEITWKTEKPFASTLTITEREMIQISPAGEKSVMDFSANPAFSSIAKTIKSLFNNNLEELEKNFTATFKDSGNNSWEMNLVPKDKTIATAIKSIEISGKSDEKKAEIKKMLISESSGDFIQYDF